MERQDTELRKHLNRVMVIRQKKDGEDQEDNIKQVKVQAFRVRRRPEENKGDRVWVDLRNAGPIESFGSESRNIRHLRERLKFIRSLRKE